MNNKEKISVTFFRSLFRRRFSAILISCLLIGECLPVFSKETQAIRLYKNSRFEALKAKIESPNYSGSSSLRKIFRFYYLYHLNGVNAAAKSFPHIGRAPYLVKSNEEQFIIGTVALQSDQFNIAAHHLAKVPRESLLWSVSMLYLGAAQLAQDDFVKAIKTLGQISSLPKQLIPVWTKLKKQAAGAERQERIDGYVSFFFALPEIIHLNDFYVSNKQSRVKERKKAFAPIKTAKSKDLSTKTLLSAESFYRKQARENHGLSNLDTITTAFQVFGKGSVHFRRPRKLSYQLMVYHATVDDDLQKTTYNSDFGGPLLISKEQRSTDSGFELSIEPSLELLNSKHKIVVSLPVERKARVIETEDLDVYLPRGDRLISHWTELGPSLSYCLKSECVFSANLGLAQVSYNKNSFTKVQANASSRDHVGIFEIGAEVNLLQRFSYESADKSEDVPASGEVDGEMYAKFASKEFSIRGSLIAGAEQEPLGDFYESNSWYPMFFEGYKEIRVLEPSAKTKYGYDLRFFATPFSLLPGWETNAKVRYQVFSGKGLHQFATLASGDKIAEAVANGSSLLYEVGTGMSFLGVFRADVLYQQIAAAYEPESDTYLNAYLNESFDGLRRSTYRISVFNTF